MTMTSELQTLDSADRARLAVQPEQTGGPDRFGTLLTEFLEKADGSVLISQDRCVDHLLDLYNTAPTKVVRLMVAAMIDDIRHVSAVRATDLHDPLDELRAAVAVESAFFASTVQPASA
jgi:hypothetical protein